MDFSILRRRIYRLIHQPPLTPFERAKKAPMYFIFDYAFAMSIYFVIIGALIAKLTDYYGFSVSVSTAIATLPALLTVLEFLSNRYFHHLRKLAVVWRAALPLVLASVLLPTEIGRVVMVVVFFLMCVAFHIYQPSYNAYTVNVTQGHIPSNYFSVRDLFFLPTSTAVSFFFAAMVSNAEETGDIRQGFVLLAGICVLFILPSLWIILKGLPDPNAPIIGPGGAAAKKKENEKKLSILEEFKLVLSDKSYHKVLLFHLVWVFFFQFAGFLSVFQIQVLDQDYFTLTAYLTISNIVRIALLPVFSTIGVKYGWKKVIYICLFIMAISTGCWVVITPENLWILFPVGVFLQSLPWAGLGIGMFYFQIACTKTETRSIYFSAHAGISGAVAFAGVICCNVLVATLGKMENPAYWLVFALWLFGIVATGFLVAWTPFPKEESKVDSFAEEEAALEAELAAERAEALAAAKEAVEG